MKMRIGTGRASRLRRRIKKMCDVLSALLSALLRCCVAALLLHYNLGIS